MKIVWSPLVASASGTAADAVAASWKGIQYIRKWVCPANPKSAAQVLVRESLARCVTLWRSLLSDAKAWLDTYGVDYRMSGFNVFISKNRVLEQAAGLLKPMPDNPHVPAPSTLAFATGAGESGDIDVTWVDNAPEDYTRIYFALRLDGEDTFSKIDFALDEDEAHTISGLAAGEDYDCYAYFGDWHTNIMGTSDGDQGVTSKA